MRCMLVLDGRSDADLSLLPVRTRRHACEPLSAGGVSRRASIGFRAEMRDLGLRVRV
jgi:hypothetical protein